LLLKRLLPLLLVMLALMQVGCDDTRQPLRLGTNVWPGYEPLYLAREQGFLDADRVRLVELLSASEVMRAYRNETLDIAALTLDEALLLAQGGIGVQVLLVTDTSFGADAVVAREAGSMQELRGKRIGVETTALGAYMLSRALEESGMTMADIEPVSLEFNQHEQAFIEQQVDAVVTFEPVRSRLLARGAQVVFDSRRLPNEVIDVLVVRPELVERRPNALRHLIRAWYQSLDYIRTHPADAAQQMSTRLQLPPDQVIASMDGLKIPGPADNLDLLHGETRFLLSQAQRLNRIMLENGLIEAQLDLSHFVVARGLLQ
jgi:NitT/TauT family transport system substrate-binding protein